MQKTSEMNKDRITSLKAFMRATRKRKVLPERDIRQVSYLSWLVGFIDGVRSK